MTCNADIASSRVGGIPPDDSWVVLGVDRAFGGNWRVDLGGGWTSRKAGRNLCNFWILIIFDPVFLDINCVRSTFGLEQFVIRLPPCSLPPKPSFFVECDGCPSFWPARPNLHSICGLSRTIAPPLNRLLHVVHGLLQENVEGVLVRIWHIFLWEVRKNWNCVLDLIMSLRCIPPMFSSSMASSVPLKKGVLWNTLKCGTQELPDSHNLHLLLLLSISSQVLVLSLTFFTLTFGIWWLWPAAAFTNRSQHTQVPAWARPDWTRLVNSQITGEPKSGGPQTFIWL